MMKISIENNIKIENYNESLLNFCKSNLVLKNPEYYLRKSMGMYLKNTSENIYLYAIDGNALILPYGVKKALSYELKRQMHRDGLNILVKPISIHNDFKDYSNSLNLRDYQIDHERKMVENKGGILVSGCGSGKTEIGLKIIFDLKVKALWLTHTKALLTQAKERCESYLNRREENDIGTITEGKVNIGNKITFATVQTMANIDLNEYKESFDLIMVDECHHCVGSPTKVQMFYKILNSLSAKYKYGLTATPKRTDGLSKAMFDIIGERVTTITDEEVSKNKIFARSETVPLNTCDDLSMYDNDYKFNQINAFNYLCNNQERNISISEEIAKYSCCKNNIQLVLCNRVSQCEAIKKILDDKKIKSCIFNGKQKKKDNESVLKNYQNYQVIVATTQIAKEGLDMPLLNILHLATPLKNENILTQCIGRIERKAPNKTESIVIIYEDINIRYSRTCKEVVEKILNRNKKKDNSYKIFNYKKMLEQ